MTAQQMITKYREMVDDQLDSDYELQLVNDAINEIESMKEWEVIKKEQEYTITSGQSFENTQALPARFLNDLKVIEGDDLHYKKYSFEDRYGRANGSNGYFIDYANDVIGFVGQNLPSVTVYMYYTENSADLGLSGIWGFPAAYHSIIPYQMASIYYASDAGEKGRAWDDRWDNRFNLTMGRMETWDDRIKTRNRSGHGNRINREDSLNATR